MENSLFVSTLLAGSLVASAAFAADGVVANTSRNGPVDFANAKPMVLPQAAAAPSSLVGALKAPAAFTGTPGSTTGFVGDGKTNPVMLPVNRALKDAELAAPQQFGTSNQPFTTARADANGNYTSRYYPYRAAGKLFFKIGTGNYICSASLIKRGVIVTAAHCVADFGKSTFYSSWRFVPAYRNGTAPYGSWTTRRRVIMSSYYKGTESCYQKGVICPNDVAVLEVVPQNGKYPGSSTGWFGYGWDGYGFTGSGVGNNNLTHVTQLGYPAALDNGGMMERTDSYGYTSSSMSYNTIIGSQQTGGSSGGPWLANFGIAPTVNDSAANPGQEAGTNRVIGTTSWGYTSNTVRQQGASPFRSSNIVTLVKNVCANAASSSVCN